MDAFVMLCVSLYIVIGIYVGVRLLRIALRSKRIPEAALGTTLFCFAALSQPAAILGAIAKEQGAVDYLGIVSVVAWLGTFAALSGLIVFTWQAFRPTERWAAVFSFVCIAICAVAIGRLLLNVRAGLLDPATNGPAIALSCVAFALAFGWGSIEGVVAHSAASKRERLGLSDSVVTNRFMLWGVSSFGGLVADVMLIPLVLAGADLTHDVAPRLAIAFSALLNAVCWFLAFAPPASYTRWLSLRAAQA